VLNRFELKPGPGQQQQSNRQGAETDTRVKRGGRPQVVPQCTRNDTGRQRQWCLAWLREGADEWARDVAGRSCAAVDQCVQCVFKCQEVLDTPPNILKFMFSDCASLRACLPILKRQQDCNLVQREAECLRPLYKAKSAQRFNGVFANPSDRSGWCWQKPPPVIVPNRLDVHLDDSSQLPMDISRIISLTPYLGTALD
jgi:hypothetical protein